jgi:hypothetical protein
MKIAQGDEQPMVGARTVRAGTIDKQYLLTGDDDSPGNFVFVLAYQNAGAFYSPRHHHNFDQWRYQIDGECSFDKNGIMKPGTLGYFPEGAYYGPQTADLANTVAVIQTGGPSGNGYISNDRVFKAFDEMKAFGHFDKGVFYRNDGVPGKKTMDSFQAVWEYISKRPMVYPTPQYRDPILMHGENYRWIPVDGAPGVSEKFYGTFTDCAIRAASYRLEPGAELTVTGRGIFLVLGGAGTLEDQPFRKHTALYLDSHEAATYRATETAEIVLMGLPDVARMRTPMPAEMNALDIEDLTEA